ncbi:hypothetical protein GCM10017559_58880 [Streptosporangium longisporum]|uniref:Ketosynthase family 3 (KS3) domain-containing protein n=1 Tax=Streptosporangium longisporum TaxID=46187 RepID=A0ABN3YEH1_9ACTN
MGTEDKLRAYLKRVTVELAQTRRNLAEVEERRDEPIAVIGMACRYPGGADTTDDFWELLREGRNAVREIPATRWDIDDYYDPDPRVPGGIYTRYGTFLEDVAGWDAEFFGLSPREALRMDPQQRMLLELAWEGLESAGLSPSRLRGSRTGVMVGYMDTLQYGRLQMEWQGRDALSDPYLGQGAIASVAAGRIAYQLDLIGPTLTVDTACSSSLIAVHLAAESLRRGECDLALAAGASLSLHPTLYIQACAGLMMCSDGRCKTFDENADGYVMGEGGGLVVLEPLSKALANGRRIRAVIRGSAVNQDGRSNGLTAPSRKAQVDVITRALAAARVTPDEIDYVEAHGSGTHLGDAIELSALHDVFGGRRADHPLRVGAVKTNIGHTQAAAGVAGLIKTVLILENELIPPNLNLTVPAAAIPGDGTVRPVTDPLPLPHRDTPRLAGVSSFGLSGTNAHLVVQAAPSPESPALPAGTTPAAPYVLPLSAGDETALREQADRLAGWLQERPGADLADVAHTLQTGRAELDHRRAVVCADTAEALRRLRATAADGHRVRRRPRIAFLLPGVGDQYAGLGRELYAAEPVYAEAVDRCVELVHRRSGVDLRPLFFPDDAPAAPAVTDLAALLGRAPEKSRDDRGTGDASDAGDAHDPLDQAAIAHPFLFTVEYALARLLAHWGVTPDLLVGYSLGEYVAATLAGVFTLEDALHVVVERAHLIGTVPAGRMVAVAAPEDRVRAVLAASGTDVDVAARNGPAMTVLSGLPAEIDAATAALAADGLACRPLRSAHAFHSTLLQPAREKLAAVLEGVTMRPPRRRHRVQPHREPPHRRTGHQRLLLGRPTRRHRPLRRRRTALPGAGGVRVRRARPRPDARRAGPPEPHRWRRWSRRPRHARPALERGGEPGRPRRPPGHLRHAVGARRRRHLGPRPAGRRPGRRPAHLPLPARPLLARADPGPAGALPGRGGGTRRPRLRPHLAARPGRPRDPAGRPPAARPARRLHRPGRDRHGTRRPGRRVRHPRRRGRARPRAAPRRPPPHHRPDRPRAVRRGVRRAR